MSWPWACVAGYIGGIALTVALVSYGGTRHLGFDLVASCVLAAVLGWWSRPVGAAFGTVIAWLFYDGFPSDGTPSCACTQPPTCGTSACLAPIAVLASAASYGVRRHRAAHPPRG